MTLQELARLCLRKSPEAIFPTTEHCGNAWRATIAVSFTHGREGGDNFLYGHLHKRHVAQADALSEAEATAKRFKDPLLLLGHATGNAP